MDPQLVLIIGVDIFRRTPDSRNNDHPPLLALELLGASHHDVVDVVLLQLLSYLLHLSSVGRNDTNFFGTDLVLPHVQELLDVVPHDDDLLDVEEAGTCLFLQILSDDTVENHGDFVSPINENEHGSKCILQQKE